MNEKKLRERLSNLLEMRVHVDLLEDEIRELKKKLVESLDNNKASQCQIKLIEAKTKNVLAKERENNNILIRRIQDLELN